MNQGMQPQQKQGVPPDTAETIHISSLALLKMIKHGIYFLIILII